MSIAMLERGAQVLAPFLDEVAFVGWATVVLWLLDQRGFRDALDGTIVGLGGTGSGSGSGDQSRVDDIVLPRFYNLAGR